MITHHKTRSAARLAAERIINSSIDSDTAEEFWEKVVNALSKYSTNFSI